MWLTNLLTAVLAVSFSTSVRGLTGCTEPSRCGEGQTTVWVSNCGLTDSDLEDLSTCFDTIGRSNITKLYAYGNQLETIPAGLFAGMESLQSLALKTNAITTIEAGAFQDLSSVTSLSLNDNQLETIPANMFAGLESLSFLNMHYNVIETIEAGAFLGLASLTYLSLLGNSIATIEPGAFQDLDQVKYLYLYDNLLTTLPAGLFEELGSATSVSFLKLDDNPDLQCVPSVPYASEELELITTTARMCECTPADAVKCGLDEVCYPGKFGYNCVVDGCADDSECDTDNGEFCCLLQNICETEGDIDAGACGDPHMTGFRGQKFDFAGEDGGWYAVVSDLPYMHLNMRVTSPVPSVPEITYITGISIVTTDAEGVDHTIIISVADPHSLESSCRVGTSPCLADGALNVVVDGGEVLLAPGEVTVAPDVAIAVVNLPGACRSFGFEKYWERKRLELLAKSGRKLRSIQSLQDMSEWILSDPTATNKVECAEYVALATADGGVGLFAHESEHASFQITTPAARIRLSHGRLHQLPMRDPSDRFDLPDHLTWQMNLAIDQTDLGFDATGILGETLVPTVDDNGDPIMQGMDAIRGKQEDYRVKGPLEVNFLQGQQ